MNPLLPIEYLVLLIAVLTAGSGYLAWKTAGKGPARPRLFITLFRILATLGLGIVAINPGHWKPRHEGVLNEWAVLVDRSRSMAVPDVDGKPRWAAAAALARPLPALAREGEEVRLYTFDSRLNALPDADLSRLQPDGEATDILHAGKTVLSQSVSTGRRLAGIILLSDGRQTREDGDDVAIRARAQESPIFAVPLGHPVPVRDIAVQAAQRQHVSFVGQKLRVAVTLTAEGFGPLIIPVQLRDAAGAVIEEQKAPLDGASPVVITFQLASPKPGYRTFTVRVPAWEGDANEGNNSAPIGVLTLESRIRVFMAEGTPYWDSKFLAQLLRRQANMDVTSVYRLSSERFFKVETDPSKASESSQPIFPSTVDELAGYDVVIFGKGAEYFLDAPRARLLREAVRTRGTCLIFSRGKPYNGALPELESLEPIEWGDPVSGEFRLQPSREGEEFGLFGGQLPGRTDPIWGHLPPLSQARWCPQLKSFSTVLMHGTLRSDAAPRPFPVLVTRRFGKGMVLAVNADGLWQWDFTPSHVDAQRLYPDFWTRLIQWSVTFSEFLPGQEFSLQLSDSSVLPDTPVRVRIGRRSPGHAIESIPVSVWRDDRLVQDLAARRPSADEPRWEAMFSLTQPGSYVVRLGQSSTQPASTQPAPAAWDGSALCATLRVRAPLAENDNLSADPDFLARLAQSSGGRILAPHELQSVIRDTRPPAPETDLGQAIWIPAWDRGGFLALLCFCLAAEWFVRRRNGMM